MEQVSSLHCTLYTEVSIQCFITEPSMHKITHLWLNCTRLVLHRVSVTVFNKFQFFQSRRHFPPSFSLHTNTNFTHWFLKLSDFPNQFLVPLEVQNTGISVYMLLLRQSVPRSKGWKFLKKLWCCVGGGNKVIWSYQLSCKCKLATITSYKADL